MPAMISIPSDQLQAVHRRRVRRHRVLAPRSRARRPPPGRRQPGRPRQPRRRPHPALRADAARRDAARRPADRGGGRHAGAGRGRRQVRLRPDRRAAGGADRHRQVQGDGALGGRAAQRRPHRPGCRLGRDGGRAGPGFGALRERGRQPAGGALRQYRAALLHRALLRRRPGERTRAAGAGLRDLGGRRRQGHGRQPGRAGRSPRTR